MRVGYHDAAERFSEVVGQVGWCVAATTTPGGLPAAVILEPTWQWEGDVLSGLARVEGDASIARDVASTPALVLLYRTADVTATVDCFVFADTGAPGAPEQTVTLRLSPRRIQLRSDDAGGEIVEWRRPVTGSGGDPACWSHLMSDPSPSPHDVGRVEP